MAAALDYNFTNFTSTGILRIAMDPYFSLFGNLTWGIFFGFVGTGLYANERSIGTLIAYLVIVGVFFSIVFPAGLIYLFGLILSFALSVTFYRTFIENRG